MIAAAIALGTALEADQTGASSVQYRSAEGARRHGSGAPGVRALGRVGRWLARVRVHRVGGGAPAASL